MKAFSSRYFLIFKTLLALAVILGMSLAEGAQLPVGFGGAYSRPCEAIAVARAGDVIELDGKGVWVDDFCPITAPGVTVRSVGGGRARVAASGRVELAEGKGIWVIRAAGVTIEGVELVGAHTRRGAGIWVEDGYGLTLRQSRIVGHERGVVSGGGGEPVVVERSEIGGNTLHNLDIGAVARLELRGNYVYRSGRGALVRSRAREQELEANRLTQESGGGAVQVELLGGGLAKVRGNVIQQQRGEGVLLGWEGTSGSGLWVVNNTLVNEGDGGTFVRVGGEAAGVVVLRNNLFVGAGEVTNREEVEQSHNYVGDEPGFVDREGLDYRLKAESGAVNAGAEAGKWGDKELAPGWQYVHVGCLESRVSRGVIDLGAYEYGGGGGEGCGSDPLGVAERSVAEGGKKRSGEGLAAEAPSDLGLQLESGTVTAGGSVTLGLRLTGTTPATGLSWKLLYPPASVSGVQMAAGAVASAAGKTLTCQNSSGAVRCLLIGVNTTALANGEVARATLQFAAGATGTVAIQVTEALGTSAAGDTMAVYGVVDAQVTVVSAVAVSVTPATASLTASQTQQFAATVTGSTNTAVTWSLSPAVGTISTSGLYTAPASITSQQTITITATSAADTTKTATATVTLVPVVAVAVTPAAASLTASQTQQFAATVTGSTNTAVTWSLSPAVGTISTSGLYTAPASITSQQTITITATSAADTTKTATATVTLVPVVAVTVSPTAASLTASQTQQFAATVTGTTNTAVTWSRSPAVGTISTSGLYTAPASITSQQTITITATSAADPTKTATATVTLVPVVAVSVSPATASLTASQTQQFAATVTGTTNTAVTWSLSPAVGTISTSGLYTAPVSITSQQTVTVTATSVADSTRKANAAITLNPSTNSTNPSTSPQQTGLAAYWPMEEGVGATTADATGRGFTGALVQPAWSAAGRFGKALNFDGLDDRVEIARNGTEILGSGTPAGLTLSVWFRADTFRVSDARLISRATGKETAKQLFMLSTVRNGNMRLQFSLKTEGNVATLIGNSGTLTTGRWIHAVAIYDGTKMVLYQDGIEIGSRKKSGQVSLDPAVPLWIGDNPGGGRPFHGTIDDVRIYNRALSPAEVQALFNGAL